MLRYSRPTQGYTPFPPSPQDHQYSTNQLLPAGTSPAGESNGKMTEDNSFGLQLAGRASSSAPSNVSDFTVPSRTPSPVPEYHQYSGQGEMVLPLTPPSTPVRSRASVACLTSGCTKRQYSCNDQSPSKKPRSVRDPTSPGSLTSSRRPRSPRTTRKLFGDAVPSAVKPTPPIAVPWVVGKGGCGLLETIPKEIRQKIYSFAFEIDTPITVKKCCGPQTTVRERRACWKHGSRAVSEFGRFNVLQVSKAMRVEALWVTHTQGLLVLTVGKELTCYLGYYRWNGQRLPVRHELDHKAMMWASVGRYRHVKIDICEVLSSWADPVCYTKTLVEVTSSLCQSWGHISSLGTVATHDESRRTVRVCVGSLFHKTFPFNFNSKNDWDSRALFVYTMGHSLLHRDEPDFEKVAADTGNNLMRLVAVIAKYCGLSHWRFIAKTQLDEVHEGGLKWLRAIQVECAKCGMPVEDGPCKSGPD